MDKLRVAVYLDKDYKPSVGGGYSYAEQLIEFIDQYSFDENLEILFLSEDQKHDSLRKKVLVMPLSEIEANAWTFFDKLKLRLSTIFLFSRERIKKEVISSIRHRILLAKKNWIQSQNIDLIYFTHPSNHPPDVPYIMTHWDLGHRTIYPFPEIAMEGNFEKRLDFHKNHLSKAFAIFAESEQSKQELIQYESIAENRIFVVPLFPGKVTQLEVSEEIQMSLLDKWSLKKDRYFYYPAQYWAHKNHYALLQAFSLILKNNDQVKLILSGSDKGNKAYLKEVAKSLQINDHIIFEGFITNEEVYTLYRNAAALVMPTFLGPTNMPLLEARDIGCPVICSDLEGHRKQMGSSAQYFVPTDHKQLSHLMEEALRNVNRSDVLKKDYSTTTCSLIEQHLLQIKPIRKTWS